LGFGFSQKYGVFSTKFVVESVVLSQSVTMPCSIEYLRMRIPALRKTNTGGENPTGSFIA
jgi:hypothetical protein